MKKLNTSSLKENSPHIKLINSIWTIAGIVLVAGLGSLFVALGQKWYDGLVKPSQFIPDFVIPIVWTVIYISLGVTALLWIKNDEKLPKDVFVLLLINGVLNVLWCLVFFTLKQTFLGNVIIIINAYFGIYLLQTIKKYKLLYSYILTLYPLWLLVATSLNLAVWILN